MSKELPFFKFFPAEWIMGNISSENYTMQGLFITACCHYWHKECDVNESTFSKILGKRELNKLKVAELVKQEGQQICIDFLDEQFIQLSELHKVRVKNGSKGGLSPAKAKTKPHSSIKDKDKEEDKDIDKESKEEVVHFENDILLNEKYIEFLKYRKALKKPVLKASIEANKKKLIKMAAGNSDVAIEIIENTIANGWQGFVELKPNNNGQQESFSKTFFKGTTPGVA